MPLLPLDDEDDDDVSFPVQTPVDKLATSLYMSLMMLPFLSL